MNTDGVFFADSDQLSQLADRCRRERSMAYDLVDGLKAAASIAPPEGLQTLRRLADRAMTLARYFEVMAHSADQSAELIEAYSLRASMILEEANQTLMSLQRK